MSRHVVRLVSLALALGGVAGCKSNGAELEHGHEAKATPGRQLLTRRQVVEAKLMVAPVEEHDFGDSVVTSGRVTFDDLRVGHAFSPVTGRVTEILAPLGAHVKKGDALAVIESPDVGSAFADVEKAQADVLNAGHELARQQELFAAHAGAQRELENAQGNASKAQAEFSRAQQKSRMFRVGTASVANQSYTLRSPIDGEVVARTVSPGAEVQGQYSTGNAAELFTIGRLDRVWVLADLYEQDLGRVTVGARVRVTTVAYPEKEFVGRVDWVSNMLDPQTRTAKVRCSFDNREHLLKPEMYATVKLEAPPHRTVAIPRSALLRIGDQTVVFVVTAERDGGIEFDRRRIVVDDVAVDEWVPVRSGLQAGEKLVTSGAILLSEAS